MTFFKSQVAVGGFDELRISVFLNIFYAIAGHEKPRSTFERCVGPTRIALRDYFWAINAFSTSKIWKSGIFEGRSLFSTRIFIPVELFSQYFSHA